MNFMTHAKLDVVDAYLCTCSHRLRFYRDPHIDSSSNFEVEPPARKVLTKKSQVSYSMKRVQGKFSTKLEQVMYTL